MPVRRGHPLQEELEVLKRVELVRLRGLHNLSRLAEYARIYATFILKEIELLQCDQIVVCGKLDDKGGILEILNKADKPIFLYPHHPSRYSKVLMEGALWKSNDLWLR